MSTCVCLLTVSVWWGGGSALVSALPRTDWVTLVKSLCQSRIASVVAEVENVGFNMTGHLMKCWVAVQVPPKNYGASQLSW